VSEETAKQKSWDNAPVDSIGVQAQDEARAYETVAQAAKEAVAPAAPVAPPPPVAEPQYITIDDFIKVDLRVAQILVAERIPKADKLLRLEVDLGYEKRQILAGIAQYYEPEKLVGRKIIIVANLAPRKMRGLESNGMLLAASLPPDGAPVLAGFLEDVPLGARLK
jgi:methionyl-tRNA synthetase